MAFEDEIRVVDRILQRWAVSVSGGAPAPWADTVASKPPPLPEDLAMIVDQCVLHAPGNLPKLLSLYYRTPQPNQVIALKCTLRHEDEVPKRVRHGLYYLRGLFEANGVLDRFLMRARS